ncbi:MAG TPA: sulfatase/phosphatase domain-containing protein, partial [Longimicrobiales bacterium]|nr:sulfatase/phosphatase domain-containing protein [Longimicrobiales bacterium]
YFEALPEFIRAEANEGRVRYHWRFDTPERYQEYMTRYYRLITEMDDAIGRVIDELKAQGVYDNTLIVFIGDNGYFQADRGLADKWYAYEESIRVPFIIRDPRATESGVTRDEMVLNIDIAPTLIAAAGLPIPDGVQGTDLAPLYLSTTPVEWRDEFFYEHPTITSRERIPASQAVVRGDMKYIVYPEWEYDQLFDLTRDPGELRNLVGDPEYTEELASMRRKLEEWREQVR